jgi:hypothetical protein
MSEHEGRPVVWQWQDAGSGAGHMQAVYEAAEPDAGPGRPEFVRHTRSCPECRTAATDCGEAARLKSVYRAARDEVTS